ncbi:MAG: polyribonucleotide nucleotidyltransferase, partial [Planctomycetota bacterium]
MLNNPISVERTVNGRTLKLETSRIAKQANGSVIISCGESVVMAVATFGGKARQDFFPLTCDYREKTYAAGRFPGGYFKREGRPTAKEVLTSRLIDRPHRPLFPAGYRTEVSVNAVALSFDGENDTDILAMVGASAALSLCEGYPYMGPTGSVRVGRVNGELVLNPTLEERAVSDLDLVVAGLEDAIIMVEGEAKEVTEDVMLDALDMAHAEIKELIKLQKEFVALAGRSFYEAPAETPLGYDADLLAEIEGEFYPRVQAASAMATDGKFARKNAVRAVRDDLMAGYEAKIEAGEVCEKALKGAFEELSHRAVRSQILDDGIRADGRKCDEIREIEIEVGFLPRTHGSVLFIRGETQAIVTATLGTGRDTQRVDGLTEPYEKKFLLHYNFPSYCVGETWPNRGPKRREIGHGALAERSIQPVLPTDMEFPYSLRIVSEITESNGSSSMATVCGGTLALMDAGVPIRRPVAGIAMGLIKEGERFAVLSDILGLEDHDGDMDFKVSGTQVGITGFQMDVKAKGGVSREIM